MMTVSHNLRIARPTDNLQAIKAMYMKGLGLELLGSFENHQGFDGVMLGKKGMRTHLEFTQQTGHQVGRCPTEDHLLVFYIDPERLEEFSNQMVEAGFELVPSYNPYWDENGNTFEDCDGYRVVLSPQNQ